MKQGRDRRWRKDQSFERPMGGARAPLGATVAVLAALLAALFAVAPAQGMTGGASATSASSVGIDEELGFTRLRSAGATWYGPGLYGNHTACGQTLRPNTIGVAHRTLPCGTAVRFVHNGHSVVARVIDRGPYVTGIRWDLTNGVRLALGFEGAGPIRYAIAREAVISKAKRRLRRARRRAG